MPGVEKRNRRKGILKGKLLSGEKWYNVLSRFDSSWVKMLRAKHWCGQLFYSGFSIKGRRGNRRVQPDIVVIVAV